MLEQQQVQLPHRNNGKKRLPLPNTKKNIRTNKDNRHMRVPTKKRRTRAIVTSQKPGAKDKGQEKEQKWRRTGQCNKHKTVPFKEWGLRVEDTAAINRIGAH